MVFLFPNPMSDTVSFEKIGHPLGNGNRIEGSDGMTNPKRKCRRSK